MRPAGCSGTIWTESGPRDGAVIMPQGSVTENVTWYDADLVPCAAQRKWEMCEQLKLLTVRSHLWRCRTETKARPEVIELRARDLNKKPSARKRQTKKAVNNVFSLTRRNPTSFCCRQVWFTPSWRNNACMTAYNNIIRWQCRNPQINYSDISVNAVCSQPLALTTFEKIFSEVKCKSVLEDQQSDLTSGPNRKVIVSTFFLQWLRNHSHKISFIHSFSYPLFVWGGVRGANSPKKTQNARSRYYFQRKHRNQRQRKHIWNIKWKIAFIFIRQLQTLHNRTTVQTYHWQGLGGAHRGRNGPLSTDHGAAW